MSEASVRSESELPVSRVRLGRRSKLRTGVQDSMREV